MEKVEILVELQLKKANAFLIEFSSSGSVARSDSDSDIESIVDNSVSCASTSAVVRTSVLPLLSNINMNKTSRKVTHCRGKVISDPR